MKVSYTYVQVCSFPCKLWTRILLLAFFKKMFSKEILDLFWGFFIKRYCLECEELVCWDGHLQTNKFRIYADFCTCLLIDLLTKSIFSKVILSPNFKILFSEKSGLEWNNWSLKFMIRSAFFRRIMSLLTVLMFWAQTIRIG